MSSPSPHGRHYLIRRFWTLNALAWAGYAMYGLWAGMRIGGGVVFSGIVLITVSVAACLWLCSGMLRAVALRQRWWEGAWAAWC